MDAKKLEQLAREAGIVERSYPDGFIVERCGSEDLSYFADLVLEQVALHLEDIDALCAEEVRAMKGKD